MNSLDLQRFATRTW